MAQSEAPPPEAEPPSSDGEPERTSRERIAVQRSPRRLLPSAKTRVDLVRRLVAPLVVALVPLFWVIDATQRAALTTLGRDQGIFQYIAWAVGTGEVDYRDIRDVNGPLIHMVHVAMLKLGSWDEHRFHVLELGMTGATFAITAALLPGIARTARPTSLERAAWGFAGWVVLMGQYGLYLYWNQSQRETFCDWFLLPSLGLMVLPAAKTKRGASLRLVATYALSSITLFGKPTYALFTVAQVISTMLDPEIGLDRKQRLTRVVAGGLLGALPPLLFLLVYGDIVAWARISFVDVPAIYRFIWAKSTQEMLGEDGPLGVASMGLAVAALLVALVALRELPRRYLVLGLAPLAALGSALAQHKGFGYHFHPLTALTHLGLMVVVVLLWERFRARRDGTGRWIALAAAAALALFVASNMKGSPHVRNVAILAGGETAYKRGMPEYLDTFKSYDFFPKEMRFAAEYIAKNTTADQRVQIYGMDPYLLFLARRKSATPYIYAYDLNDDAAMDGGWHNEPDAAAKAKIRAARDAHEADMLARLAARPPEAFVFIDKSPLISYPDAWEDFRHCCAKAAAWVASNYHPARTFGDVIHVWVRDGSTNPDEERMLP